MRIGVVILLIFAAFFAAGCSCANQKPATISLPRPTGQPLLDFLGKTRQWGHVSISGQFPHQAVFLQYCGGIGVISPEQYMEQTGQVDFVYGGPSNVLTIISCYKNDHDLHARVVIGPVIGY